MTRAQLRSCRLSDKQIEIRIRRGELVRVLPGIFRSSGSPDSFGARLTAASLWMGDKGFFNGETAAYLLGLDGIDKPQCITVARYAGFKTPSWLRVHRLVAEDLPPLRRVKGHRVCCVERVLLDCSAALPARRVGRAMDDALRRRLTTPQRLREFVDGDGLRRPGNDVLRELVRGRDESDAKVRSVFEAKMLAILRRIPSHGWVADFKAVAGGSTYFIDFFYPVARLGIECHSFKWHIGKHNEDARRDRRIRALGIDLLYFTWDDVCFDPAGVEQEVRAALARRSEEPGARIGQMSLENAPEKSKMQRHLPGKGEMQRHLPGKGEKCRRD